MLLIFSQIETPRYMRCSLEAIRKGLISSTTWQEIWEVKSEEASPQFHSKCLICEGLANKPQALVDGNHETCALRRVHSVRPQNCLYHLLVGLCHQTTCAWRDRSAEVRKRETLMNQFNAAAAKTFLSLQN